MIRIVILCAILGLVHGLLQMTVTAKVGANIRLPCRLPAGTSENVVAWYVGTRQLTLGMFVMHHSSRFAVDKPAPGELNLIIKSVVKSDEDVYTCKSQSQPYASINVQVQWKPEIDKSYSSKPQETAMEGVTTELKCVVSGQPLPNITWYRRAQDETEFQDIGVTGESMTIHSITRYGSDVYMCNATNEQGWATWEMNVTVHFPPTAIIMEQDLYVPSGYKGHLMKTCVIQGSPVYDYYWIFNNTRLTDNWKYQIFSDHDIGYPVYFLTLVIRPRTFTKGDYGTYTCHADGSGREAEATIDVKRKPEPVTVAPSNGNTIRYN